MKAKWMNIWDQNQSATAISDRPDTEGIQWEDQSQEDTCHGK